MEFCDAVLRVTEQELAVFERRLLLSIRCWEVAEHRSVRVWVNLDAPGPVRR